MQIKNLKIRPIVSIVLLIMMTFFCQPSPVGGAPIVNTDKDIYNQGEMIKVNFSDSPGDNGDWICIVPVGSPDTDAGDYQYMPKGLSQGVLTFDPPSPGKYEVRAYFNYRRNGYVVSARHGFSVGGRVSSVESEMASPAKPRTGADKIKPVESQSITDISRDPPRISVSVFHFTPLSMDASPYGITVTNTMMNAPKMQSSFVMLGRKDLETFLAANNLQQNDQTENVINIGTRMGVDFVIAGSIGKRGTMIVTNCKVVSIEQRKVVFTNQFTSTGEADLISNIMKMSDAIIEAILRSTS
jgi:TolB-like protein